MGKSKLAIIILVLGVATSFAMISQATVPRAINYQGYLTNGSVPLNGTFDITFNLYDGETAPSPSWSETIPLNVVNGIFSAVLGGNSGNPIPSDLFDVQVWLGIKVGADGEMIPRKQLTAVAYSIQAANSEQLNGLDSSAFLQSSAFNVGDLISCYSGDISNLGVGPCKAGLRKWDGVSFSACQGEILPGSEVCDGIDNDCDGEIDENGGCCSDAGDCSGGQPSTCNNTATCQGTRVDPVCSAQECGTVVVDDDSGCGAGIQANDCGLYLPVYCTGAADQAIPVCPSICSGNQDCDAAAYCDSISSQCEPGKLDGQTCASSNECISGYCVDGVCCNTACGSSCDSCSLAGSLGTCSIISAGSLGEPGCSPYTCNGASSGCPSSCSSDANCALGNYCNSSVCAAKLTDGQSCITSNQCVSGYCVDGVCCATSCGGVCETCNQPGSQGTCVLISYGSDPDNECPGGGACGGFCNGAGSCYYTAPGTQCGTCRSCNGSGSCLFVPSGTNPFGDCPDPEICDGNGSCFTP